MTQAEPPFWQAVGFQLRLAAWIEHEQPAMDIVSIVLDWIKQQLVVPYRGGVRRELDISANLWWGQVPGTYRNSTVVLVSYWIDEEMRTVRCDQISTLSTPI